MKKEWGNGLAAFAIKIHSETGLQDEFKINTTLVISPVSLDRLKSHTVNPHYNIENQITLKRSPTYCEILRSCSYSGFQFSIIVAL